MKENLAVFDMDGTLFDTNKANYLAYKKAMEPFTDKITFEFFSSFCNGKYYKDFLPMIYPFSKDQIENIHHDKLALYETYLYAVKENIHLFNIIDAISSIYNIALVTTASRKNCEDLLKYFGKYGMFDLILTHNDIQKKKPDPEGFLLAMDYFRIPPKRTIIFEDSDLGVQAALSSKASVITVTNF